MSITRRKFLQQSGMAAAAAAMMPQVPHRQPPKPVKPVLDPNTLTAFVDPLPIPDVARAAGLRSSPDDPKLRIPHYRLAMREFHGKVHRDMKPTRLWGIGSSSPGPTLETESGKGIAGGVGE